MDIAKYISDLLNEYNEVSLPGVGTFFKRNVSSHFDQAEGLFYPPSSKVDFKADEGSDASLISHIVSNKNISESSAIYFIERFCENIKNSLEKDSSVSLTPLGTLFKTDDSYRFESETEASSREIYGLMPIKEREIISIAPAPFVAAAADNSGVVSEEPSTSSKGLYIVLAVLLLLGTLTGLAYYFYPQYFKNFSLPGEPSKPTPKKSQPVPAVVPQDSVSFADSIVEQLEKEGLSGAQVTKAPDSLNITTKSTKVPDTTTIPPPPRPQKEFEVIVASYDIRKQADAFVRSLRKKGIDAKVIMDKGKQKFKVSIGTFPTMNAAHKENKRIHKEGVYQDSWILTVNNKEN